MEWEQRIEHVLQENLELEMLDWKRHNWEIVSLAPATMQIARYPSGYFASCGRTVKVTDYLVILKRTKLLP